MCIFRRRRRRRAIVSISHANHPAAIMTDRCGSLPIPSQILAIPLLQLWLRAGNDSPAEGGTGGSAQACGCTGTEGDWDRAVMNPKPAPPAGKQPQLLQQWAGDAGWGGSDGADDDEFEASVKALDSQLDEEFRSMRMKLQERSS
mmetsp:Transcript_11546/g.32756  ORF Transcript_11546/g.32756 Transcript_11546/m.32756 type:complete len:145 (-) Transcript_11546:238-672(-)